MVGITADKVRFIVPPVAKNVDVGVDNSLWMKANAKSDSCTSMDNTCWWNDTWTSWSMSSIDSLIRTTRTKGGWTTNDNIYLGGFGDGCNVAVQYQLAKSSMKLGGVMCFNGYPTPVVSAMVGKTASTAGATYTKDDMRFMFFYGADDKTYPATAAKKGFEGALTALGAKASIKMNVVEAGVGHYFTDNAINNAKRFIKGENNYVKYEKPSAQGASSLAVSAALLSASLGYLF